MGQENNLINSQRAAESFGLCWNYLNRNANKKLLFLKIFIHRLAKISQTNVKLKNYILLRDQHRLKTSET